MSTGKIILGVVAGVAVGALLGVLFAPDKGKYTRKKITKKGEDYVGAIKDKFSEFIDGITEKFQEVRDEEEAFTEQKTAPGEDSEKEVKTAS